MRPEPCTGAAARHAIVIGGSIEGCLVAQALSEQFARVTIIEKGAFDGENRDRRSVPQERHVHLLLLRGKQVLERMFPGCLAELEAAGATVADLGHDVKWFHYGQWKNRYPTGIFAHYCSRGLIDATLRRRILANKR